MSASNNQESVLGDYVQQLQKQKAERERKRREQEAAQERQRREEEARRAAEAERLRIEEEERLRIERRKAWWKNNWKKLLISIASIILLLSVVFILQQVKERKHYQAKIEKAKAYIASGDSCLAITQYDDAYHFYLEADIFARGTELTDTIQQKVNQVKQLKREAEQKAQAKQKQGTKAKANSQEQKTTKFQYKIENGVCIISEGTKNIINNAFKNNEDITSLIIPQGVTSIGDYAFDGCTNIKSITIPSSVKKIGFCAFEEWPLKKEIYFTGTLEEWCNKSWGNCQVSNYFDLHINGKKISEIVIPTNCVKEGVFSRCENLTSVVISQGTSKIGKYAFSDCPNLVSITIPNSVKEIGYAAFQESRKLTITIPYSVTEIGKNAFIDCKLVKAPEKWKGTDVFWRCKEVVYY